ncbi:MAG: hypothetical protein RLY93_01280 [Sumerlaeia bacterium]
MMGSWFESFLERLRMMRYVFGRRVWLLAGGCVFLAYYINIGIGYLLYWIFYRTGLGMQGSATWAAAMALVYLINENAAFFVLFIPLASARLQRFWHDDSPGVRELSGKIMWTYCLFSAPLLSYLSFVIEHFQSGNYKFNLGDLWEMPNIQGVHRVVFQVFLFAFMQWLGLQLAMASKSVARAMVHFMSLFFVANMAWYFFQYFVLGSLYRLFEPRFNIENMVLMKEYVYLACAILICLEIWRRPNWLANAILRRNSP